MRACAFSSGQTTDNRPRRWILPDRKRSTSWRGLPPRVVLERGSAMPDFQPHAFDRSICRQQVQELKALLDSSADLGEAVFHDFFEPRLHLRALIGRYNHEVESTDRLAWQYPIFGDFRCDFAIGDWTRKAYTFVEYEDARPNSLFVKQGEKATRAWSPRFDSGYSQIIDWFYKLQVMTDTPDMEARFGKRSIRYLGVLIIGREQ